GALVVLDVHAACQGDELVVEGLRLLLDADVVLDHPQPLVDRLEPRTQFDDVARRGRMRHPGLLQRRQLGADIGQLGRVGHALGLDLQDRDLVEQFAVGDWNEDLGHAASGRGARIWRRGWDSNPRYACTYA